MAQEHAPSHKSKSPLEEDLELSNVTEFRQNLLPVIERMEKNPALRLLILKHGKPQAVLMSVRTYDLVKKIVDQVASQAEDLPRQDAIDNAYSRLRSGRQGRDAERPGVTGEIPSRENLSQKLELIVTILGQVRKELSSADDTKIERVANEGNAML